MKFTVASTLVFAASAAAMPTPPASAPACASCSGVMGNSNVGAPSSAGSVSCADGSCPGGAVMLPPAVAVCQGVGCDNGMAQSAPPVLSAPPAQSCSTPPSSVDIKSILSSLGLSNWGSLNMAGGQSSFSCSPTMSSAMIAQGPGLLMGGPAAVYWQSNDPNSNVVFSANVDDNGIMTFGGAFSTGGKGSHIGPDINAPNALASQASVKVVQDKLVVVNAGSDTATLYQIDFENPALIRMIGPGPVSTMGNFPVSATIDPGSRNVCILNGGQVNGVSCYKTDLRRGLVPIENSVRSLNLNLTTPPASEAGTVSQIVFADDGKRLFASVKGSPGSSGFIAVWEVNDNGSLSENFTVNQPAGGNSPASLTFVRGADAILNTDATSNGYSIFNFAGGQAAANGASLTAQSALTPIGQAGHPAWSEFSDATRNYYISDSAVGLLTEVQIDPATLQTSVVQQVPLPAPAIDQEVDLINGKDTIFLVSPQTMTMEVLSLVAPGQIEKKQSFDLAAAAAQAGVPLSPANVQGVNGFFTG
ncbi:hypothetical protein EXIGLDRAFT_842863 [Exidia glandulosa HHB12029]|uniref:3-carboxy-cis,cis-mucoante lactonizing enzyme n=1 Tax=Exidia glandulosa HHB12029 TaxID=1314781 RepID=A0A165CZY2_EXIGL|nr:hypothetical protein EXIGLDRAFT_842863 [Exidia glandulosa HHB12029]